MTNQTTLSTLTVKVLREKASSMNIKGYGKMKKAELIVAIEGQQVVMPEVEQLTTFEPEYDTQASAKITARNTSNLLNKNFAPTSAQCNYLQSLLRNYEVESVEPTMGWNKATISVEIDRITNLVKAGQVAKRTAKDVDASLKAEGFVKTPAKASQSQLDFISKLERETGVINTKVVRDTKIANEIINELLAVKRNMPKQHKEVAVTTTDAQQAIERVASIAKQDRKGFASIIKSFFGRWA